MVARLNAIPGRILPLAQGGFYLFPTSQPLTFVGGHGGELLRGGWPPLRVRFRPPWRGMQSLLFSQNGPTLIRL